MNKLYNLALKHKRYQLLIGVFSFSLFLFISNPTSAAQLNGEKLFNAHCSSCHNPTTQTLIGPGLQGITKKESMDWIHTWVKNSQEFVKSGNPDAVAIFNKFNIVMPPQPLNNDQIDAIMKYIELPDTPKGGATAQGAPSGQTQAKPVPQKTPIYILIVIVAVLLIFMIILKNSYYTLKRTKQEQLGEEVTEEPSLWGSFKSFLKSNRGTVAVLVILIFIWICKVLWDALFGIGVYQGYQPKQPIAFSHHVHAGIENIPCQYCHSSAHLGKTSGIPTANVCMNCHKYIHKSKYEPHPGEIAKIYKAIGFDPTTGKYIKNYKKQPIKWVKIHNLPDFVYFPHSQHVVVGKIACQKCHGPVKKFTVMKQYAPLTMGWCINCHRQHAVQVKNGYYQHLIKSYPPKLFQQIMKDGKLTVAEQGGIECGKCHY